MSNEYTYDPDENFPSPIPEKMDELIYSTNIFLLDTPTTPAGINPSNRSSLGSPPPSASPTANVTYSEPELNLDEDDFPFKYPGTTLPTDENFQPNGFDDDCVKLSPNTDFPSNTSCAFGEVKLYIIAQPQAYYRERYFCETDPNKKQPQRFIRVDNNNAGYEYPTIKLPSLLYDLTKSLYIQVTSVTVKNENVMCHYIHPYPIDTPENNVIKDPINNSLYFPIDNNEFVTGAKTFHISRKKMIQHELKSYGSLHIYGSNQPDNEHFQQSNDAKKMIDTYQLKKSQLVFTIAERYDNCFYPVPMPYTSVISQIMTDIANDTQKSLMIHPTDRVIKAIQCIPQKADWKGGDQILIIMPYLIKQKEYSIVFDFGSCGKLSAYDVKSFDRKILSFRAPSCPLLPRNEDVKVSIIITENNVAFPPIDFYYVTPMQRIMYICSRCQGSMMNNGSSYKRRCEYDSVFENDSGDHLVSQMNQLSLEKKSSPSHSQISSNNNDSKLEKLQKYLDQLKDALQIFIRTNDPSQLFRQTRRLISNCDGNGSPLHDAIENGHAELALSVIKQIIGASPSIGLLEKVNEHGESALLIASKCNEWKVIEIIVRKRCDLAEQKDENGNNMLHILGKLAEDKGAETIKHVLHILPSDTKKQLLNGKNKANQTAIQIAQSAGNIQCLKLLN